MQTYKHLFFDMDKTISPARSPLLPEMAALLRALPHDITIVSGGEIVRINAQTSNLPAYILAQNGNHAVDLDGNELWYNPLHDHHRAEIMAHIEKITAALDHELGHEYTPIEDRGAQITFSPVGNHAPHEIKNAYDPDATKRTSLLEAFPLESEEIAVKIGGSTSFDYIHKHNHKGSNTARLIEHLGWDKDNCIYFGDGLFPGGNDEAVIGVIETILVQDHLDTYEKLRRMFT